MLIKRKKFSGKFPNFPIFSGFFTITQLSTQVTIMSHQVTSLWIRVQPEMTLPHRGEGGVNQSETSDREGRGDLKLNCKCNSKMGTKAAPDYVPL